MEDRCQHQHLDADNEMAAFSPGLRYRNNTIRPTSVLGVVWDRKEGAHNTSFTHCTYGVFDSAPQNLFS